MRPSLKSFFLKQAAAIDQDKLFQTVSGMEGGGWDFSRAGKGPAQIEKGVVQDTLRNYGNKFTPAQRTFATNNFLSGSVQAPPDTPSNRNLYRGIFDLATTNSLMNDPRVGGNNLTNLGRFFDRFRGNATGNIREQYTPRSMNLYNSLVNPTNWLKLITKPSTTPQIKPQSP